ncbi:hypothetical protein BDW71DRAFT_172884 [Aspergillus fruticulosus]
MSDHPFLLRLPYSVRYKIYVELGIVRHEPVDLSCRSPDGEWSFREQKIRTVDDHCPWRRWITNQLFYVSRAVSADSRTVFYSENRFEFARHIEYGLKDTKGFSPLAWRSFRYLSFALDQTYHYGGNEYGAFQYGDWFCRTSVKCCRTGCTFVSNWRLITHATTGWSFVLSVMLRRRKMLQHF